MNSEYEIPPASPEMDEAGRVLLKVCGVTRPEQAAQLRKTGVNLVGLNFHPPSPRYVDPETAADLVHAWGDSATAVGVFVDRTAEEVLAVMRRSKFGIAQLHGDETAATVAAIARSVPVIRAFRIRDMDSIAAARRHIADVEAAGGKLFAALIDGYSAGAHGGTGQSVGESFVRASVGLHPRLILAGGLNPANLAERLEWIRPWCVDVASGVETAPGIKDLRAVESMARCLRAT